MFGARATDLVMRRRIHFFFFFSATPPPGSSKTWKRRRRLRQHGTMTAISASLSSISVMVVKTRIVRPA